MRWILLLLLIIVGLYFFLKKNVTQEAIDSSAPVKYVEDLKFSKQKASEVSRQANRTILQNAVNAYSVAEGEYPPALNQLRQKRYLRRIPPGPWEYDPQTGQVK